MAGTWLITWNPTCHSEEFNAWSDTAAQTRAGRLVKGRWSCGRTKSIARGDLLFLMKQGAEPRGLVAKAEALSDSYADKAWKGKKTERPAHYIDLRWTAVVDSGLPGHVCMIKNLPEPLRSGVNWNTAGSGIRIREELVEQLEREWAKHWGQITGNVADLFVGRPGDLQYIGTVTPSRSARQAGGYDHALEVATGTARAAGALLRQEFCRPGGPRGGGGHCPADAEAEALIRTQLAEAFPEFGILGEELSDRNRAPRDSHWHCWLIDPNDGTSAMLKGHRGTAVSIALLRGGNPVLGVVCAYAPPIARDEDLFAWAEGCGPLTRNGVPVNRRPLRVPTDEDTVAVSQDADRESECNAMLVAPARFHAVASIAYRLALVACGEVEAAVSLNGPRDWDYAGGHALLRAVGGELFDEDGHPITYDAHGRSSCRYCFGGAAGLGEVYKVRSWEIALHHGTHAAAPYDLIHPDPRLIFDNAAVLGRAQGCLLGQCAGDSLGSLVEFQDAREIRARHPNVVRYLADGGAWHTIAGQPTDDTEMALMLARALVRSGSFDDCAVADAYAYWFASPPFDAGNTTRQALRPALAARQAGEDIAKAAREAANSDSQANGALMRVSPLGILGHAVAAERLADWARADATLTHPHAVCQDASALVSVTIARAVRTGDAPDKIYAFARDWADSASIHTDAKESLAAAESSPPEEYMRQMGWVRIALQNAFYQLLHAPSLEAGVVDTVMRGGDTDTTGAICGALLGAAHGIAAVPQQWRDRVLTCRPIRDQRGVHQPRPRCYWPVDALLLAERLLCLGRRAADSVPERRSV